MDQRYSDGDEPSPWSSPTWEMPPPKRKRGRWIVVGLFGLLVALAAAAALGGTKDDSPAAGSSAISSAPPALISPAAVDVPSLAPPPPPAKQVVLTLAGNGTKTSKSFTTGPDWSVKYTFDCSGFLGGTGNFQVFVYTDGASDDIPVNALDASGADTTYQHDDAGSHYLVLNSECNWTVTVTDGDSGQ